MIEIKTLNKIALDLKKSLKIDFFHNIKFSQIKDLNLKDEIKGIIFDLGYSINQIKDLSTRSII